MAPRYKFNPPPNWPPAPPGWQPPYGWEPPESWGPPPQGWPVWVRVKTPFWQPKVAIPVISAVSIALMVTVLLVVAGVSDGGEPSRTSAGDSTAESTHDPGYLSLDSFVESQENRGLETINVTSPQYTAVFTNNTNIVFELDDSTEAAYGYNTVRGYTTYSGAYRPGQKLPDPPHLFVYHDGDYKMESEHTLPDVVGKNKMDWTTEEGVLVRIDYSIPVNLQSRQEIAVVVVNEQAKQTAVFKFAEGMQ